MAQHLAPRPGDDDDEDDYRAQVARYPRLSNEEEERLLATHGHEREAANKKLIEHNLYLVFEAAEVRRERGVPFGDLFQEGTVGLISAVEHYRSDHDGFRDRLVDAITATMDDVLVQTEAAQRNDEAFVTACRLLEAAQRLLEGRLNRPATPAELAKLLQWDEARVKVILEILSEARDVHDQELLAYLDDADGSEA